MNVKSIAKMKIIKVTFLKKSHQNLKNQKNETFSNFLNFE